MIYLQKDTENKVVLTLTEKATLSAPFFLFELTNETTNTTKYFVANDISAYPERYNLFNVTLVNDEGGENLLGGIIYLEHEGFYSYTVYEQEDSGNLDPDNAAGVVETGKALVEWDRTEKTAYETQDKTRKVYERE